MKMKMKIKNLILMGLLFCKTDEIYSFTTIDLNNLQKSFKEQFKKANFKLTHCLISDKECVIVDIQYPLQVDNKETFCRSGNIANIIASIENKISQDDLLNIKTILETISEKIKANEYVMLSMTFEGLDITITGKLTELQSEPSPYVEIESIEGPKNILDDKEQCVKIEGVFTSTFNEPNMRMGDISSENAKKYANEEAKSILKLLEEQKHIPNVYVIDQFIIIDKIHSDNSEKGRRCSFSITIPEKYFDFKN